MVSTANFALTDNDWKRIVQYSTLPAQARPLIEDAIGLFRAFEAADSHSASEIRAELRDLHDFHARLAQAMANPDMHAVLSVPPQDQNSKRISQKRIDAFYQLESAALTVDTLARWFLHASGRVPPTKPGKNRKALNVHWLVGRLDAIRTHFTGQKISRSSKGRFTPRDYIKLICQIADPTIGSGTVERAMQLRIKQNKLRDNIPGRFWTES